MEAHSEDVYEGLANHLNRLPVGFPRTPSGVEIRILKRLFTPEEALLAQVLTFKPELPEEIAERIGAKVEEIAERLEKMAKKGLIFRLRKGSEKRYMAANFIVGIWEYHVNDLTPELIVDLREYVPYFFQHLSNLKTPQMRVIPTPGSITAYHSIMPYEEARKIIESEDLIAVAPCICRKEHKITGEGCNRPLESCLMFGVAAQYYVDNGLGRFITKEEALKIIEEAERDGRVLEPSNAQKITAMCTCCGCCCQILISLKKLPKPANVVVSRYIATLDESSCVLCGTCLERCQMEAISLGEEVAIINGDRCIGCGLCVTTCPQEAIKLVEKPSSQQKEVPPSLRETYARIFQERMAMGK
ncbi:MAG: 4Fe-4S binding protein [Syntrophobacterales bacterium]|nr:4Fe-4S binding protein [Syntrophobacterales bacterium]